MATTLRTRSRVLTAALIVYSTPIWAATTNVDVYGQVSFSMNAADTGLPTHETYAAAADIGNNSFFFYDAAYTPRMSVATGSGGAAAAIAGNAYAAFAGTRLGSNHAYAQASAFPSGVFGAAGFSGWYDQVTISGGTGIGIAKFTVQLNGTVDVGALSGGMGYTLGTSSIHPSQLTSELATFNVLSIQAWPMDAVSPITTYLLAVSPYDDASIFHSVDTPSPAFIGIPSLDDGQLLGGEGMGFPVPDQILTPGAGQNVSITLNGTLDFTYGEAFYLIGGLGTTVVGDSLASFCGFTIGDSCTPTPIDGTGPTTLDFTDGAHLVNIALPHGATATFASDAAFNVTAVPEPGEWLMLLAGLGLVGWRTRRRA